MNTIKILFVATLFSTLFVACDSTPQITMNPVKDAQTCIKLYKKDAMKGECYMQQVVTTYDMQGKGSECDRFSIIVADEIAKMHF